ncbi:MAG: AMP-binding protein [Cytophagales bacterium]|nr:AMP-binding protein [Cytophagales bacterium]
MKPHPWLKHYPKDIPHTVDPERYASLIGLMEECCEKYSALPAYENMGVVLTYREVDELSKAFAAYLQNHTNLKQGDSVAIQLPNLLQYPVLMFGILRAGMIVVNTNPLYTPREMQYQFADAGVKAVVILANFAHNLAVVLHETPIETVIITEVGDLLGEVKGWLVNVAVKYLKGKVPRYRLPGALMLKSILKKGRNAHFTRIELEGEAAAFLQYTGGTTGISKGAVLTHRNMIANVEQVAAWMRLKLKEKEEVVITPSPLYHIFSLTINVLAMLKIGAKNILITNPRDLKALIKELKRHHFTAMTGVNTLFKSLLSQKEFATVDFSNLKVTVGGGMAIQAAVAEKWEALTGVPLVEGYGLTEASPVVSANLINGTERIGTVGIPFPSTEVKVVDDAGKAIAYGQPGELLVKGPQVMKGYWKNLEETENVFLEGWLKTGDIAVIDQEGFIKIVDRKKDMINVSGFNVYPSEIENVVASHLKVIEVSAIGVPNSNSEEAVKIFVVRKDISLTEEELIAYCRERLTPYKVPKYVEFRNALPKSPIGKTLKIRLKKEERQQESLREA